MQVIAHNLLAQFTNRQLNINSKDKTKSSEKLSTGYRINRSADDAAGLSISEKMRGQIRGLNKASRNIEDGISLCQVADGAMDEIGSILQRIRELTVQGLNDTNADEDRHAIQLEMDAMLDEIDSIAKNTNFNGVDLLQGDYIKVTEHTITTTTEEKVVKMQYVENSMLPSWATVNGYPADTLTPAQAQMQNPNLLVDVNTEQKTDLEKYITQPDGSIKVESNWSDNLQNNWSSVIDFSGLGNITGVSNVPVPEDVNGDGIIDDTDTLPINDVYMALNDLVNKGFAMNCATCEDDYGVIFTTKEAEKELSKNKQVNGQDAFWNNKNQDPTKIYIDDLLEEAKNNPNSGADIAKELVSRVIDKAESGMDHFTHYVTDAGNPAKLVVYDFRDDELLQGNIVPTVRTKFYQTKIKDVTIPPQTNNFTYNDVQKGLMIQSGANEYQAIPIHLDDVMTGMHGLNLRGHIDLMQKQYSYSTTPPVYEDKDITIKTPIYGPPKSNYIPEYYNAHGEKIPAHTVPLPREVIGWNVETHTQKVLKTPEEKTLIGMSFSKNDQALSYLDDAIGRLSDVRTSLGAKQNQLEYARLVDDNTSENLQSSESKIRDTDMADEMVNYSKNNILEQAAQAMLVQANQLPQNVLNLLK